MPAPGADVLAWRGRDRKTGDILSMLLTRMRPPAQQAGAGCWAWIKPSTINHMHPAQNMGASRLTTLTPVSGSIALVQPATLYCSSALHETPDQQFQRVALQFCSAPLQTTAARLGAALTSGLLSHLTSFVYQGALCCVQGSA